MNTRSTPNPSYEGTQRYFWTRADDRQGSPAKVRRWVVVDSWTGQPHSWHGSLKHARGTTHDLNTNEIERIGA